MRIILIGFMGCGKSTIGKRIAKQLAIPFIDSDLEIERCHQKTVPQLFEEFGEAGFRQLEKEFILSLSSNDHFVLATGGGLPCFNDTMHLLNQLGTTIYLKRPSKELARRLIKSKTERPLIKGKSFGELVPFIEEMLEKREEFYLKSAHIAPRTIDKPAEILEFIGINQKN